MDKNLRKEIMENNMRKEIIENLEKDEYQKVLESMERREKILGSYDAAATAFCKLLSDETQITRATWNFCQSLKDAMEIYGTKLTLVPKESNELVFMEGDFLESTTTEFANIKYYSETLKYKEFFEAIINGIQMFIQSEEEEEKQINKG